MNGGTRGRPGLEWHGAPPRFAPSLVAARPCRKRTVGDRPIACELCGATNPAGSQWCGQCLARFEQPASSSSPAVTPPPAAPSEAPPSPPPPAVEPSPQSGRPKAVVEIEPAARGAWAVTSEGIEWTCAHCAAANPLAADSCSVCGASFADTIREEAPARSPRDPGKAALFSLVFPGAGHAYIGLWGQAAARGVISTWVVMVAIFSALQRGSGSGSMVATFSAVAFGLWLLGAHDAYREADLDAGAVLLKGRRFVFLVLGLLLLLAVLLVAAGLRGAAGTP